MWFTEIDGVREYQTDDPAANRPAPSEDEMGMEPGMGPEGEEAGPPPVNNEVAWLRLKGHSLVMDEEDPKGVEDHFKENLKKSPYFAMDDSANFKHPQLTVNSGKNNVTSFVIYVKLKNPIKQ
jgi:hypothetical protein